VAAATAAGYCLDAREVLFGVSPARLALLDSAAAALADAPRAAAEVRRWREWMATHPGADVPLPPDLVAPVARAPMAARALALTSVAIADAFICCWDAKFTYWTERPITADPTLDVLIPTPPFPSFTSGHATASTSAATILGHLFPADATDLLAKAAEASQTRLWAGIHFRSDIEAGLDIGRKVGQKAIEWARNDGSQ